MTTAMGAYKEHTSRKVSTAISRNVKRFLHLEIWKEENTQLYIVHSGAIMYKKQLNRNSESSISPLAMWPHKKYAVR